ncbi:MAG TPA: xanthine dehydrogenase family protein molybdopterin-binding subunit [Stellaceae bacterium]|nr:xanthine dehydrogenase family protein molybdopterin-binding subunit [Stellaceae bacterium]
MTAFIGQPIRRKEDRRLLTGRGRFTDDLDLAGEAHAAVLRSPHAHARIAGIEVAAAARAPGVLAILTGRDYAAAGFKGVPHAPSGADHFEITKPAFGPEAMPNGPPPLQPPLAQDRVRYVGEAVAFVIAETLAAARDAAELIEIAYETLPAAIDARAATAPGATPLWDDRAGNLLVAGGNGDRDATDAAFARAHRVVRLASHNQRVSGAPMEPRVAIGQYDAGADSYTIHSVSQGVHRIKFTVAACLGVAMDKVRVITGDVGGGFGVRSSVYPEYAVLAWAAKRVGRPVKWNSSRSEAFLADFQARDVFVEGALALDRDGKFLALQLDYTGNLGAYPVSYAVLNNVTRMAAGVYDIPAIHVGVKGVATNTMPMSVYRGAGRPESNFMMERLVDLAAAELGIERAELRRRNIIPTAALPYQSPLGHRYDTGAFADNMEAVLRLVDWTGFPARRDAARKRGMRRGIGVANYLETPTGFVDERTDITVLAEGGVRAVIGTQASGQGHETAFAQIVAERLQLPLDEVDIQFGDTAVAVSGGGTHSDRSMRLGSTIMVRASDAILERGKKLAALRLEAAESDIVYADGRFSIAGTDKSITLYELATVALDPRLPEELRGPFAATAIVNTRLHAYPNGAAACEVEIDPELGAVRVIRYATIDDVGHIINPMIVEGQIHGGAAQGIGQALMEAIVFDASGQILTGSFMDYAMPRADDLPPFAVMQNDIPAQSNPLGVKGAGEAGVTPATSAVINAVVDALGIPHIEMPATPERVWRALRDAT